MYGTTLATLKVANYWSKFVIKVANNEMEERRNKKIIYVMMW